MAALHQKDIDLLVTEVRLPQLFGWELLELLALDYPKLRVVYVSNSIEPEIRSRTRREKVLMLEQPFRGTSVRQAVRDALENPPTISQGMEWTASMVLLRLRNYFRRYSWMHRAAS